MSHKLKSSAIHSKCIRYAHKEEPIPERVVRSGIALAMSTMVVPSSCTLVTLIKISRLLEIVMVAPNHNLKRSE